jgi:hypothetical protein
MFHVACPQRALYGLFLSACALTAGCQNISHTESGALIGTGLGAGTGAAIGNASGHAGGGALIGAAAGAVAGSLVGNAEDAREERDAAVAHAQYVAQAQQAVTNADIINMTRGGISDDVIIGAVRTRGGRFDLSPNSIIQLKHEGVSDNLIMAMQTAGAGAPPPATVVAPAGPPVVVGPPPSVVVVPPGPTFGVFVGPRRYYGPPPRYYRRPSAGVYYRW